MIRPVGSQVATQVAVLFLALASSVVTARALGAEGRGAVALVVTAAGLAAVVVAFGADSGATYEAARRQGRKALEGVAAYGVLCVAISLLGSATTYVITGGEARLVAIGLLLAGLLVLQNISSGALVGRRRYGSLNLVNVIQPAVYAALVGTFFAAGRLDVPGAIAAFAAGQVFATAVAIRLVRLPINLHATREAVRVMRFAWKLGAANVVSFLNYRVDVLLVGAFLGLEALGLYSVAVIITERLWYVPTAISNLLFPAVALSGRISPGDVRAFRAGMWLSVAGAAAIATAAPWGIPWLFTQAFEQSVELVYLLLPGTVALGAAKMYAAQLSGVGKPHYALIASVSAVVVDLALLAVLMPTLGVEGVAIAASAAYIASAVTVASFYRRESGFPVLAAFLPRVRPSARVPGPPSAPAERQPLP